MSDSSLPSLILPEGVESHYISSAQNDIRYHFLSAGKRGDPLVLLYHGFPEMAYCWRHVLPRIAAQGYYAVAPDTRGSGRTTMIEAATRGGQPLQEDEEFTETGKELLPLQLSSAVRDGVIFVRALGYDSIHCLVGHDAGGVLAPLFALSRPDLVKRLVVASHPYTGPRPVDVNVPLDGEIPSPAPKNNIQEELGALPEPRKHYKWYYATAEAGPDLHQPTEGIADFLRNYYYLKSASWPGNKPHTLEKWDAPSLAQMPFYYIMPRDCGMREACKRQLELSGDKADVSAWMSDEELACMAREWERIGFRRALNWYRISTQPGWQADLDGLAGAKLKMPTIMMLGRKDWGSYQQPGVLEKMGDQCEKYLGERWIEDAGHWMQQEKVEDVTKVILELCSYKD